MMSQPNSSGTPSIVALILARSGSKRVTDNNIRPLAGHPVIAFSIAPAIESGIFAAVIVSTDSERYAEISCYYGAEVPFMRPAEFSGDRSPDIERVEYTLKRLAAEGRAYDGFSILRPTIPFRLPETIQRPWAEFRAGTGVDSLRAVEKCTQHPGKMWVIRGRHMLPLLPTSPGTAVSTRPCLKCTFRMRALRSPGRAWSWKAAPSLAMWSCLSSPATRKASM